MILLLGAISLLVNGFEDSDRDYLYLVGSPYHMSSHNCITNFYFSAQDVMKMAQNTSWTFDPYLGCVEDNFCIRRSDLDIRIFQQILCSSSWCISMPLMICIVSVMTTAAIVLRWY